jgi:rod shape-determining protein MreD
LLINMVMNMGLLGRAAWTPDLLAVVLLFWSVHQPLRIGVGVAFVFGLVMDVQQGALLGQHALAYTVLSFFAMSMHRRLLWFTVPTQAVQLAPLFLGVHLLELLVRMASGGTFPGWLFFLAPLIEALFWTLASVLLLAPQRRAPDPDENRPL